MAVERNSSQIRANCCKSYNQKLPQEQTGSQPWLEWQGDCSEGNSFLAEPDSRGGIRLHAKKATEDI